MHFWQSE
jgi:hypothetical protein